MFMYTILFVSLIKLLLQVTKEADLCNVPVEEADLCNVPVEEADLCNVPVVAMC